MNEAVDKIKSVLTYLGYSYRCWSFENGKNIYFHIYEKKVDGITLFFILELSRKHGGTVFFGYSSNYLIIQIHKN